MQLIGKSPYTLSLPNSGTVTYVKGETLHPDHAALVPEADRALFTSDAPAPAKETKTK